MAFRAVGLTAALAGLLVLPALAQDINRFNERQVDSQASKSPQDRSGIWVLDFKFKDPRVMTVDIPGRGRKLVWYLWYQVSNPTGAPRTFIPRFVWVCHDEDTVHNDQVLPKAQLALARLEDPDDLLGIKNSVTMSATPIPVSKEYDEKQQRIAFPKLVTGVATWDNINPKSTQFSIYVYGLSDGWSVIDGPDGKPLVRVKTLQLKFKRLGDEFSQNSGQIRYQGHEWIYAPAELPLPSLLAEPKAGDGAEMPAPPPGANAPGSPPPGRKSDQ
jgi:hypothetical protein